MREFWKRVDPRAWTPDGGGAGFRLGKVRLKPAKGIVPRWAGDAYLRIVGAMALIEGWATQLRGIPREALLTLANPDATALAPDELEDILSYTLSVMPYPGEKR